MVRLRSRSFFSGAIAAFAVQRYLFVLQKSCHCGLTEHYFVDSCGIYAFMLLTAHFSIFVDSARYPHKKRQQEEAAINLFSLFMLAAMVMIVFRI